MRGRDSTRTTTTEPTVSTARSAAAPHLRGPWTHPEQAFAPPSAAAVGITVADVCPLVYKSLFNEKRQQHKNTAIYNHKYKQNETTKATTKSIISNDTLTLYRSIGIMYYIFIFIHQAVTGNLTVTVNEVFTTCCKGQSQESEVTA